MSYFAKFAPVASLGLLLAAAAGCTPSSAVDAKTLAEYRTRLALAEEPDGVQTVADVRLTLLGEGHDHDGDGHQDHAADDHDAHDHDGHEQTNDGDGVQDHAAADHADHDPGHASHAEDSDDHEGHDHDEQGHSEKGHSEQGNSEKGHDEHSHNEAAHAAHDHASEAVDVAMIGHIGGLANPWAETQPDYPFAKTEAVFYLADPQAIVENEASGHSHAPGEECAFCAAHAADQADMLARVQFVDKKGDVLRIDVRQLFDVKEQDTVVVRGKARVTAGGILVVDADGLYIRR